MTQLDKINYLNIFLIFAAAAGAFLIPFELFFYAYAFIGPLHYLTEIFWLEKSGFHTQQKFDYLWLVVIGIAIAIIVLTGVGDATVHGTALILIAFLSSLVFLLFKDRKRRLISLGIITLLLVLLFTFSLVSFGNYIYIGFSVLLPTLIHVHLFTCAFMLYGAIKSNSKSGYISVIIFLVVTLGIFFISSPLLFEVSPYVKEVYWQIFRLVNDALFVLWGERQEMQQITQADIFQSQLGVSFMRLIAFSYVYHYLNWFSKTSIIKWHKVAVPKMMIIIVLWFFSILLYAYDYKNGFYWLFFLSFLHVLLEFPLNFKSFITIGQSAKNLFAKTKTSS